MFKVVIVLSLVLCIGGCNGFRYGVDEAQKQNAYLHGRVAQMAKSVAAEESICDELAGLVDLNELQSRAFVADYGLPEILPAASTVEEVLAESSYSLAGAAMGSSVKKPDAWDVADGALDIGIAVAGLFGGVWGIKIASLLRSARLNGNALREVVLGNEVFKKDNAEMAEAFKSAHGRQSTPTRKIVADMKVS